MSQQGPLTCMAQDQPTGLRTPSETTSAADTAATPQLPQSSQCPQKHECNSARSLSSSSSEKGHGEAAVQGHWEGAPAKAGGCQLPKAQSSQGGGGRPQAAAPGPLPIVAREGVRVG